MDIESPQFSFMFYVLWNSLITSSSVSLCFHFTKKLTQSPKKLRDATLCVCVCAYIGIIGWQASCKF